MPSADPNLVRRLEAHADRVFRLCLHLTGGCHAEAQDLAQETLIAAFRALPRFLGRAQLSTYLHTVAVHAWRRRAARRAHLPLEERDGPAPDGMDQRLTRIALDKAIAALPEAPREAFLLVKVEGLTHREAARVLNVPQGTVQSRVHEAVRSLRAALFEENPS